MSISSMYICFLFLIKTGIMTIQNATDENYKTVG